MLNNIFTGVFNNDTTTGFTVGNFMACILVSIVIGVIIAITYTYKTHYTKSFTVTLAMLPAVVCVVVIMVNGNIGTGVTVAGAFSLVRFRSIAGTAKEIGHIFLAMGAGLILGMGYLGYALLFTIVMCIASVLLNLVDLGIHQDNSLEKTLRITIPEDLNYGNVFDDVFEKYTSDAKVTSVKTTNMGSMFKLTYNIKLKNCAEEKEFIDELRLRNGNLEICMSGREMNTNEL